jgi:hypothetical protein
MVLTNTITKIPLMKLKMFTRDNGQTMVRPALVNRYMLEWEPITVIGKMAGDMVKESWPMWTRMYTLETGRKEKSMEMVPMCSSKQAWNLLVNGTTGKLWKVSGDIPMAQNSLVFSTTTNRKARVNGSLKMETLLKGNTLKQERQMLMLVMTLNSHGKQLQILLKHQQLLNEFKYLFSNLNNSKLLKYI